MGLVIDTRMDFHNTLNMAFFFYAPTCLKLGHIACFVVMFHPYVGMP